MQPIRASAVQYRPGSDKKRNLTQVAELIAQAAAGGSNLVALPELFSWSGPQSQELDQAEAIPGPTSRRLSELAGEHGVYLVGGSILERPSADATKCYNTSLLFGPDGSLATTYRKMHLFDIEIGATVRARESTTRGHGSEPVCVNTQIANIGLAICYDLRFPELFRALADRHAEVVVMPSAFTAPTGAAHWSVLVRARAIENQCFVVAPNQYGPTAHGFDSYGHSLIVDPWGTVLAEAGPGGPVVIDAELDPATLERVRRELPSLRHRRLK